MKRFGIAALVAAIVLAAAPAGAQSAPPPAPAATPDYAAVTITTTDLGAKTYMLQGLGGNMTVAVTPAGEILVDSEFAPLHDKIKAAIAALSPQPVKFLINTHFHGDHTGGNAAFATEGATVVANVNVKTRLSMPTTNALTGAVTPPSPAGGWPAQTYTDATTVILGGRTARVTHVPNGHTDGDTYVYFPDANVLATGDIVTVGNRFPNIDVANGGTIGGMIAGTDTYIALANDATKIVPGHGPLLAKSDLITYRAMLATIRDRIAILKARGGSEADVVATNPLVDFATKLNVDATGAANFTRLVYRSLKT